MRPSAITAARRVSMSSRDNCVDQDVDRRRSEPHERLDHVAVHARGAEQVRQGAANGITFHPAEHDDQPAQVYAGPTRQRLQDSLGARRVIVRLTMSSMAPPSPNRSLWR